MATSVLVEAQRFMSITQSSPRRCGRHLLLPLLAVSLATSACGGGGERLYPVHGQVFYEGKPADGAIVFFHPQSDPAVQADPEGVHPSTVVLPSGKVGPDGSFELTTYNRGKGAPAGRYVVTVSWIRSTGPADDDEQYLLPAHYLNPATSALPVEIKDDDNKLPPFQLTR